MKVTQGSMLQSLRDARNFVDKNGVQLGELAAGMRQRLENAIEQLGSHVAIQTGSFLQAKGATQEQRALRKALIRDHMAPIARIAALDLVGTPNIEPLRMPKPRIIGQRLVAVAEGMGKLAAKFAPTFIAGGLPADFVDRLNAATAAIRRWRRNR